MTSSSTATGTGTTPDAANAVNSLEVEVHAVEAVPPEECSPMIASAGRRGTATAAHATCKTKRPRCCLAALWGWSLLLFALACVFALHGALTLALGSVPFTLGLLTLLVRVLTLRGQIVTCCGHRAPVVDSTRASAGRKLTSCPSGPSVRRALCHCWLLFVLTATILGLLDLMRSDGSLSDLPSHCGDVVGANATLIFGARDRPQFNFGEWIIGVWSMVQWGLSRESSPTPDHLATYKVHPSTQQELEIAVWRPPPDKCTAGCPAVLYFHGGGWIKGNLRQVTPGLVDSLTARGVVVFSAQYTFLSSPPINLTDCYLDGRDALRWLRAHADEYGVARSRVTLMGVSAGGWIASIVGNRHPEWAASILSIVGRHDLTTGSTTWDAERQRQVCGDVVSSGAECWLENSPLTYVSSRSPPTILVHGTNDATVPYANSRDMHDALQRAGVQSCLVTLPGDGHALAHIAGGVGQQTLVNLAGPFVTQEYQ